jgi:hypothetical protein
VPLLLPGGDPAIQLHLLKPPAAWTLHSQHFRVFTTPGVEGTKRLPLGTVAVVTTAGTLCLVGTAACGATPRLIGEAFRLIELLFTSGKSEGSSTIGTSDRLVLKTHWLTSSLRDSS